MTFDDVIASTDRRSEHLEFSWVEMEIVLVWQLFH